MRAWALRQLRRSAAGYAATVAVVAVVTAFAVLLIESIAVFTAVLERAGQSSGAAAVALGSIAAVFLGIAVLVAVVVIGSTFSAVYAGRMRDIATLRLLGATSAQIRATARLDGVVVGAAGALIGLGTGIGLGFAGLAIIGAAVHATLPFEWSAQLVIVPPAGAVAAAVFAAGTGVREAAKVSPAEAARSLPAGRRGGPALGRGRAAVGTALIGVGAVLLALGAAAGFVTPAGLLPAFAGGALSFIGVVVASARILPPLVRLIARVCTPRGAAASLAAANLRLDAVRTARVALAVLIGVTVLTMFQVAGLMAVDGLRRIAGSAADVPAVADGINGVLLTVDALTSFSVVVAAIGLGSTLALSVAQRRREIGVLRALGFTAGQARAMLRTEGLLVATAGAVGGLLLGTVYGWIGAVAVLGRFAFGPPAMPPVFAAAVLIGALVLGVVASAAPGRTASRVRPAVALQEV